MIQIHLPSISFDKLYQTESRLLKPKIQSVKDTCLHLDIFQELEIIYSYFQLQAFYCIHFQMRIIAEWTDILPQHIHQFRGDRLPGRVRSL